MTANNNADHVLVQIMVAGHRSLLVWVETDAGQDVPVHGCHPVVPVDLKFPRWAAPVTLPVWPSTSAWAGPLGGQGPARPGPGGATGPPGRGSGFVPVPVTSVNSEAAFEVGPGASGMAR